MNSPTIVANDGDAFDDLEGFWNEVSRKLIPGADWGRNLDAFNDILRGGFGTPEGGFVLCWGNSERSRLSLGYEETARWLERKVARCHPVNVADVRSDLANARARRGPTPFDILVQIIEDHGAGGNEPEDGVELRLQ